MGLKYLIKMVALIVFIDLLFCPYAGAKDLAPPDIQNKYKLILLKPKIDGLRVELNGVHNLGANNVPEWNWGDGSPVAISKFPAVHVYSKPGKYEITLTVRKSLPEGTIEKNATTSVVVK